MKKLLILALSITLAIASCQKSSVAPDANSLNSSTSSDALTNRDYLTAHTWMYNKYYIGYIDSTHKGKLQYRRGGSNNLIILDNTRDTYFKDNTETEIDENGNTIPATWHFTNKLRTKYVVTNYTGSYHITIVRLDNKHFNWYYTDIHGVKRYGEEIPAN